MDSNLIMAIIALAAIFSPLITCLINNYYQDKYQTTQNYELAKREALSKFIKSAFSYKNGNYVENSNEYNYALNNLYIYFENIPNDLYNLDVQNEMKFDKSFQNHIITLSKQIKKK